jgi:hypothetical protein
MRYLRLMTVLLCAALLAAVSSGCTLSPGAVYSLPPDFSGELWEGDIYFLEHELPKLHADPNGTLFGSSYHDALETLKSACTEAEDARRWALMRRFVASLGAAHTAYSVPMTRAYPLNLTLLSDGVFVTAALGDSEKTLELVRRAVSGGGYAPAGVKLVGIEKRPLFGEHRTLFEGYEGETVLELLSPYLSHENEGYLKMLLTTALLDPDLLHSTGVTSRLSTCSMTFQFPGGELKELSFDAVSLEGFREKNWAVYYADTYPASREGLPEYLRYADEYYWGTFFAQEGLLYILYNRCANSKEQNFADFTAELIGSLDLSAVRRTVVDLRSNSGGDSRVISPLKSLLADELEDAQLYVITGPATFSSGLMNAVELSRKFGGILTGAPTGGRPNHYGEVQSTRLPSGNTITWSRKYFTTIPGCEADALYPDIPVETTTNEFFSLQDPVLDYIKSL